MSQLVADKDEEAIAPAPAVRGIALRGTIWVTGGFVLSNCLRFGANIVFTRLLLPEAFGLMAVASGLLQGLQLFSDIGVGPAIVQHKDGENPRVLNTAWTAQLARGFAIWAISACIAYPVSLLYGVPLLTQLLPAMGATAAIAGFNSTSMHVLVRRFHRAPLVALELGSYAVGLLVAFLWMRLVTRDVWGFVIGSLVTSGLTAGASHFLIPALRNRIFWDRGAAHEIFHFGKWVFLRTMCTFLADQSDRLVLAIFATLTLVGIYSIAQQLAAMPLALVLALGNGIVFPLYSRFHHSEEGLAHRLSTIHPLYVASAGLISTGLFVAGPFLILLVYKGDYREASWMIQLLAVGAFFKLMESASNAILMATGNPHASALNSALKVVALVVLLPLGWHLFKLPGFIGALAVADVLRYLANVWAVRHRGLFVWHYDAAAIALTAVMFLAAYFLGQQHWMPTSTWAYCCLTGGVALGVWGAIIARLYYRQSTALVQ